MRLSLLRNLLVIDSAVLFLLGAALVFCPKQIEVAFHFDNLPEGVSYLIGLWGCGLVTMAVGYVVAASDPVRHVIWVQVGIARGIAECALGAVCLARGFVTFPQAGLGIVLAGLMSLAYLALYPRKAKASP